jgi:hypothetical protein
MVVIMLAPLTMLSGVHGFIGEIMAQNANLSKGKYRDIP